MHRTTKLIHTKVINGENIPIVQPIYQTTLFKMPSYLQAIEVEHEVNPTSYYTRMGNPTTQYLADQLCNITGYDNALIFPSGMAAIFTSIMTLSSEGNSIAVSDRLYGDTSSLFINELDKFNVKIHSFDVLRRDTLKEALKKGCKAVYFESLSNPELVLADICFINEISSQYGAITVCDSTFTPPGMIEEINTKIDVCIYSLTKYICGNFTVSGGAVLSNKNWIEKIWEKQILYGTCIDPNASWLISQNLPTLELRTTKQSSSAQKLAEFLSSHSMVKYVIYPGLYNYPQKKLANKLLLHGGGVIAFALNDGAIETILESTEIITLAVSLGGYKSLIEHADVMSHSRMQELSLYTSKQSSSDLIRLSVGLEDPEDLILDLSNALKKLK